MDKVIKEEKEKRVINEEKPKKVFKESDLKEKDFEEFLEKAKDC